MAELSLCMIVRNEEKNLQNCLESVRGLADEIVIVDTGSTDGTKAVAARYTDRIYDYAWRDDFAHARNTSFFYAQKPFILWLDADDVIEKSEAEKLSILKTEIDENVDAVMMPYQYGFRADGKAALTFYRERIVRRDAGFFFEGNVHEAMAVRGNVIYADIAVRHTGQHGEESCRRNLRIYEKCLSEGKKMTPRDIYYYARELKNAGQYECAEQAFQSFIQGEGWIENKLDAWIQRGDCLQKLERRDEAKMCYLRACASCRPSAEALCALGAAFMEEEKWEDAAFWYRAAMLCRLPGHTCAFVSPDAYGYIPLMQLCVCYDRMGAHAEAARMNEQALLIYPDDAAALKNREYFSLILRKTGDSGKIAVREA